MAQTASPVRGTCKHELHFTRPVFALEIAERQTLAFQNPCNQILVNAALWSENGKPSLTPALADKAVIPAAIIAASS